MDKTTEERVAGQKTAGSADHEHAQDDSFGNPYSKEREGHNITSRDDHEQQTEPSHEKNSEVTAEQPGVSSDLVAKEDYSVFTVPQKRAIVVAGSFIGWFSPMTGAIYYPALDQVRAINPTSFSTFINMILDRCGSKC